MRRGGVVRQSRRPLLALALASRDDHRGAMLRRAVILFVILGLAPGVWLRSPPLRPNHAQAVDSRAVPRGPECCSYGPLRLTGAWRLISPNTDFGGWSALLVARPGRLLAFSDRGYWLDMPQPGQGGDTRISATFPDDARYKENLDIESATRDPESGRIWIALEGRNAISRHAPGLQGEAIRQPEEMRRWPINSGAEAMLRLADGRFVAVSEASSEEGGKVHPALLFPGDPTDSGAARHFGFAGPAGYRPVDMAQLPDGRVLVLMRRLRWPIPARFLIKLAIADPAGIAPGQVWRAREIADLNAGPLQTDNFEGLAVEPGRDGAVVVWLISDDNSAVTQQTLLWRMELPAPVR